MPSAPVRTFTLTDCLVIGYGLMMTALLTLFGRPLATYLDEIAFYLLVATIALGVSSYIDERRGPFSRFIRLLYPALLLPFFYQMTGGTMHLLVDRFLDPGLIAFEERLFGADISLLIDSQLPNVFVTELLSLAYWLYYPLIPVFLLSLFLRKDYEIIKSAMAAICLTFFVGYTLFFLYPIEGPRWFYAGRFAHDLEGILFRPMVEYVIRNGAVRGGCMPSTHFAVTLVITLYLGRHYPRWLWLMVPLTLSLGLGTVWGRFHYLSDVIVGGIIALAATAIVWRVAPAPRVQEKTLARQKEAYPYHAS